MRRLELIAVLIVFVVCAIADATPVQFWWTGDRAQEGQMTMYNPSAEDGGAATPVYSADIDDDGRMDAILSCITGDGQDNDKPSCGELHVLFGVDTIRGEVDFTDYDGVHENLLTIWGRSTRDYFGSKSAAADLDGDGVKDLIVGAAWCNTPERENSGEVFIIWGGSHLRNRYADLDNPAVWDSLEITNIIGAEADDKLGVWLDAGDVDGDEIPDLLIGAPRANGFANDTGSDQTGEAYLLYGPFTRNTTIDLVSTAHPMTVVFGVDPEDQMGNTLELADVNGDDFADVIIGAGAIAVARLGDTDQDYPFETGGAGDGPGNVRDECGEVYILFGEANLPDTINLAAGMPLNSTIIYGAHGIEGQPTPGGDGLGEEIATADINGDGILDVVIGAFRADGRNNDLFQAGAGYLFYGRHAWPRSFDLADGIPDSTTAIYGGGEEWLLGDSTPLGDVNGDGFFDVICGCAQDAGPYSIHESGTVRVILGSDELLPSVIDFADPPDTMFVSVVQGAEVGDLTACWIGTGDFNGDGYWDLIPGIGHGDGPANERHNAGDFHILSGEWITNHPGQPRFLNADPDSDRVHLSWHDNDERGGDHHVIYRRDADTSDPFDSMGTAPYPALTFTDATVDPTGSYEYRVEAVAASGLYSNPSNIARATLGVVLGSGLPLIVNGLHWDAYDPEIDDFYADSVLLGDREFDFWDLYSTSNYPGDIDPIGHGTNGLAAQLFDSPLVLWMLNAYDPGGSDDDGDILYDLGPVLCDYLHAGGQLVIIGRLLDSYLSPELQSAFTHTVAWGFHNTITSTAELTPVYPGLDPIGKRSGADDITGVPSFSIDASGCPLILHSFANSGYQWMSAVSRGSVLNPYNICLVSTRPYRADPLELRGFMEVLLTSVLGHYSAPTGVTTEATSPGEIVLRWDASPMADLLGYRVLRSPRGEAPFDTLGFVAAGVDSFVDSPPNPLEPYDYMIFSEHDNGLRSLDSQPVSGFSPPVVGTGPLLIINGVDWDVYGAEIVDLYTAHALQGSRPFVFWDLFATDPYPPGYEPIGFGVDSLIAGIWNAYRTIWVHNNYNGDGSAFVQMQPVLEAYVDAGGELFIIGKELDETLSEGLMERLGIDQWIPGSDWPANAEAFGEHPLLTTVTKATGVSMSLVPEFSLTESSRRLPVYRLTGMIDQYVGVVSSSAPDRPIQLGLLSIRPYRADLTSLGEAMETIHTDYLGQLCGEPITDLTILPESGTMAGARLRWSAVPDAVSYIVCRVTDPLLPTHRGTIVGETADTTWVNYNPPPPARWFYLVYPAYH